MDNFIHVPFREIAVKATPTLIVTAVSLLSVLVLRRSLRAGFPRAATWRKAYSALFKLAGVEDHCHQFRHTYATRLLQAGVPLNTVSIMLAHSSVKITQKHYAAWTRERGEKIEAAIRKTWESGTSTHTKPRTVEKPAK